MRVLATLGVLLVALFAAGVSAPVQASVVHHESPGKCPPGSYWTHLPTPGLTASASGFCKSYVVRPTTKAPLAPLHPAGWHHGLHRGPPPLPPHHHHGWCPLGQDWSTRLRACLAGGTSKPTGGLPLPTPNGAHTCPPGSHWHSGIHWAGECQPDAIRPITLPVIQRPEPVLGVSSKPKPNGPAFGIKPLRHR